MEYFISLIIIVFLYIGYKDDFKYRKAESAFLTIMVGLMLLIFIALSQIDSTLGLFGVMGFGILGKKFKRHIINSFSNKERSSE